MPKREGGANALRDARVTLTRRRVLLAAPAVTAGLCWSGTARAAGEFAGKTITMIVGFPPGGGVDTGARLMAKHLPRFLDGAPNIVIQNMPGAGGATAADYLFSKAPRDGLIIGVPGRDWPLTPILDQRGGRYDPLAFEYIGSTGAVNTFLWISMSLGVATPADLRALKKRVVFGGLTPDTQPSMVPKILALDGFPLRSVSGYRGTAEVINAIDNGEVDGIATNAASFARRPDMLAKTVCLLQLLKSKDKIPLAADHVSERSRELLQLTGYASATGMPLVAPPNVPPERTAVLKAAFANMARDKDFAVDAERLGEPHGDPIEGGRIREILSQTIAIATPSALATYRELAAQAN